MQRQTSNHLEREGNEEKEFVESVAGAAKWPTKMLGPCRAGKERGEVVRALQIDNSRDPTRNIITRLKES